MREFSKLRPYAKAIFTLALRTGQLAHWQEILEYLAVVAVRVPDRWLTDPRVLVSQKLTWFYEDSAPLPNEVKNLLVLLATNKRLQDLPGIATIYRQLVLEQTQTLEVVVMSVCELTPAQKERLVAGLQRRYHQALALEYRLEPKLLGGLILHVGSELIDFSIQGTLAGLMRDL